MSTETKQPTLLSDLPPEVIGLHRRIADMHQVHGVTDGKRCATCEYLKRFQQGATWHKCTQTNHEPGARTDWYARWPACGLYRGRETA